VTKAFVWIGNQTAKGEREREDSRCCRSVIQAERRQEEGCTLGFAIGRCGGESSLTLGPARPVGKRNSGVLFACKQQAYACCFFDCFLYALFFEGKIFELVETDMVFET